MNKLVDIKRKAVVILFMFFDSIGMCLFCQMTETRTLNDYIRTALAHNPSIQAQEHQWQAEQLKVISARTIPDPRLQYGYFLENVETAVGPQEWKLGLTQSIPWPGKLNAMGKRQSAKAGAAYQKLREIKADIEYQIKSIYFDFYFLIRQIEITQKNLDLMRQWHQIILTKYKTATAGHPDLIKSQIEILELEERLNTLAAQKLPLITRFNAVLGDSLPDIEIPDSLNLEMDGNDKHTWEAWILDNNPGLKQLKLMEIMTAKSVSLAKSDWLPDIGIGMDYIATGNRWNTSGQKVMESGKDPLMFMGSINLPLWGFKQASQVRSAKFAQLEANSHIANMQNQLAVELESIWFEKTEAERKISLVRNQLFPLSMESLNVSEKAYIGGQMDFITLIDAQRRLFQYQLDDQRYLVNYKKAIARLEKLAGRLQ